MNLSRPRLRAAVATPTVLAGLLLSTLAGVAAAVQAEPAASAQAAPSAAAAASGFTFHILSVPNAVPCIGAAPDDSADPSIDRNSCAFVSFDGTEITDLTKLTAEVYEGSATTKFADVPTSEGNADGEYQVQLEPDGTWAGQAGRIRLVVKYDGTQIGELPFFYNHLVTEIDSGAPTAPGAGFTVTGSITEHVGGTALARDAGVPASFKVRLTLPDGSELFTSTAQTAAADGTYSFAVPGSATAGLAPGADDDYRTTLGVELVDVSYDDTAAAVPPQSPTGVWKASSPGTSDSHVVEVTPDILGIENSFVSSVGWVKPGETYPSRIILTNPTAGSITPTSVEIDAPTGSTILTAGATAVNGPSYTWNPGAIAAGETKTLVLESKAATTAELDTIVWRDLSSTATLAVPTETDRTGSSHGPKVIPPSSSYDTARYGDRPFPVVPVQYTNRTYQDDHSGDSLESVINDASFDGSTFNLYQEMSLGQLYPEGTVPSQGVASADFPAGVTFDFTARDLPGDTCTGGVTYADTPFAEENTPLYPTRITNGVYNLPGNTEFYGADGGGTGLAGPGDIDSGCGSAGKLVRDAAIIADPEIDYSDYDTDKDGVVDFFMAVFAGCGGNGASQLSVAGCPYLGLPYDNIWPHSSSLEFSYSDPVTGLRGYTTDDQLKNLEGQPLWYTDTTYSAYTTTPGTDALKVFVRVGPYNVNPETAIDKASVISHEYGHSLGLPDFYSNDGTRETYGDWNLMATDKSQNIDAFGRQELGWVVPEVLDSSRVETDIPDSKVDIGTITWQKADGTPYTLTNGPDGVVHNSQMYVAKLPGRQLLDPALFTTGDTATPTHAWWSQSGNDYGCAPESGHNLDLLIPELASVDPDSTVELEFKSLWDIEWEYDYGFVLTTTDGGASYTSHASAEGYTTAANDPTAAPQNSCQVDLDNGLTGTSGSYAAGTETTDRNNPNGPVYPSPVFLADSYDISDLAGEPSGTLRFSYATDSGLARPGWFIDDLKVTVTEPGQSPREVLVTDFETSVGPDDPRVYNGGCREGLSTATKCTVGWNHVAVGDTSPADHAYYLEMRDRSGFDFEGRDQIDRSPLEFTPGFFLAYTDENHGYGNAGTSDPPAQSPLDSVPVPGDSAPNLNDAAFVDATGRSMFSDREATPHVSNYLDPESDSGNWEFGYDCLKFTVDSMTGEDTIQLAGDLVGDVSFDMGTGCGDFDYGYTPGGGGGPNTAPTAAATAVPSTVKAGAPTTLSAAGSTDAETPNDLDYSWSFGDGGTIKDADGKVVQATYSNPGAYTAKVTVTDPQGLSATATTVVTVLPATSGAGGGASTPPKARIKLKSKKPDITRKVRLSGRKSTGTGPLTYAWNFHNGGKKIDATGKRVKIEFKRPGRKKVTLFVTDINGQRAKATRKFRVRGIPAPASRSGMSSGMTRVSGTDDLTGLFLW